MILSVITVVIACLSPVGSSHCLAIARNPQCVNLSRYSQLTDSSQSQVEDRLNRLTVCGARRVVKVLIVEYPRGEQGRQRLYNAE